MTDDDDFSEYEKRCVAAATKVDELIEGAKLELVDQIFLLAAQMIKRMPVTEAIGLLIRLHNDAALTIWRRKRMH